MIKDCFKCRFFDISEEPCKSCDENYSNFSPEKSQEVSAVLKLMDKDYSFEESVDIVLTIFEVDRNQFLEELNYFI